MRADEAETRNIVHTTPLGGGVGGGTVGVALYRIIRAVTIVIILSVTSRGHTHADHRRFCISIFQPINSTLTFTLNDLRSFVAII